MDRRLMSMISLCRRAGALVCGGFSCERTIQAGKARLVIVCVDASGNTKKKFSQKAFHYGAPYCEAFTQDELGRAVGIHSARAVAVVTDENFSGRIFELIKELSNCLNEYNQ